MQVKNNLRVLMAHKKMTIRDVHKKTGLSEITISKLYNEKSKTVSFNTISTLCDLFDCKIGDLLYIDESTKQ